MKWTVLPAHDTRQRVRVERVLVAAAGSVIAVFVALALSQYGYIAMRDALTFAAIVATIVVAGYALVRSGGNLRYADPSLTVPFLVAAAVATSYVVYYAERGKVVLFVIYVIAFLFGALTLPIRKLVWVGLFYWFCYLVVVGLGLLTHPESIDLHTEFVILGVYFVVLAWFAGFGWYIGNLRRKFRAANSEMARAMIDLETLARIDGLTRCYNRRYAMEFLEAECNKPLGRPRAMTLCLLDVDHFKHVNDNYGHQVGDSVLQAMVDCIMPCLRGTDLLARYGGEEFLLVLPHTAINDAMLACERIRRAVAALQPPPRCPDLAITVSIGAAEHVHGTPVDRTLNQADEALYQAKGAGRDRVVRFGSANAASLPA